MRDFVALDGDARHKTTCSRFWLPFLSFLSFFLYLSCLLSRKYAVGVNTARERQSVVNVCTISARAHAPRDLSVVLASHLVMLHDATKANVPSRLLSVLHGCTRCSSLASSTPASTACPTQLSPRRTCAQPPACQQHLVIQSGGA